MVAANSNFDNLLTTTLANYRSTLTDNVFTARPLTYKLMEGGRIRMLNGGTKIVEPLIYGQNSTVGSYSGYETTFSHSTGTASRQLSMSGSNMQLPSQSAVSKKPRTTVSKKSLTFLEAKDYAG
jgi:hypothetical protein